MDPRAALAAYDEQVRRNPVPDDPDGLVERDEHVVRVLAAGDGWAGVTWSDLDRLTADAVIAAQVERFAGSSRSWEWKHYSPDAPHDLPDRLLAAGFVREPAETLLVAEIAELPLGALPPAGVELRDVVDEPGVAALVTVHDAVFGGDHFRVGHALLAGLRRRPSTAAGVVAWAGDTPVAAGRLELLPGTDFAGLWGGCTIAPWRGRGAFRALVAHRARVAASRGFRYLQVDATPDSRPILRRLGFVELATTTPFTHLGADLPGSYASGSRSPTASWRQNASE